MTDTNEQEKLEKSAPAGSQTRVVSGQQSGSKVPALLAILALLIAAAGAGACAYLWHQLQLVKTDNELRISQFGADIASQKEKLSHLTRNTQQSAAQLASSAALSSQLENQVQGLAEKIASITGLHEVDWRVSQALHLSYAAQQRLALTHDVEGAQSLLEAANSVLGEVKELGIIDVRRALAKDIMRLKVAAKVDVAGTFIKLGALKDQIQQLSLPPVDFEAEDVDVKVAAADADWQGKLAVRFENLWNQFNSQWQVEELDQPIKPILSTDQRAYLKQNLNLLMEQAQLAVMRRDAASYHQVLNQAQSWTQEHFNLNTPVAQSVAQTFSELKSLQLNPEMPDISGSVRAVAGFVDNWKVEKQIRQQQTSVQANEAIKNASLEPAPAAAEPSPEAEEEISEE